MDIGELRTRGERKLFTASAVVSGLVWLVVAVTVVGLLYGLLAMLFALAAHALLLAHLKGSSVRLGEDQLPQVYSRVKEACARLGLPKVPEAFLVQQGGALNAFATRFLSRDFIVVFSDLLEACGEEGREADMVIGHEAGHIALGHLRWQWFLLPARLIPWLGSAYSRACEYSCDLCGLAVAGDLDTANRGLAVLAAGGVYGRRTNLAAFSRQTGDLGGFWASVHELNASHPPLARRVAALVNRQTPGTVPVPRRNFFAYPLAPLFGLASPQGIGGLLAGVAVIGILAAIAIPNYLQMKERAEIKLMDQALLKINSEARVFFEEQGFWPCDLSDLDLPDMRGYATSRGWKIQLDCDANYAAIFYKAGGQDRYRAIFFESGQIKGGAEGE